MVCQSCCTPNQDHFKFCRECGQRLAVAVPAPPSEATIATTAAAPSSSGPATPTDELTQAARLLDQAFDLYDEERYEDAIASCQASLALDPSGTTAHSLLGMIYERLGKSSEAVRQYQLVLQMDPGSIADATKLDSLLSRRSARRGFPALVQLIALRRTPAVAGAATLVVVLVVGLFAASRANSPASGGDRRIRSASQGPVPGASMKRPPAAPLSMPGGELGTGPSQPQAAAAGSADVPGASQPQSPVPPTASLPSPPAANAWPGLRGGYPAAPPVASNPAVPRGGPGAAPHRRDLQRTARADANGFLAPAPVHGVEKIDAGSPTGLSPVPGASLPAFPGAGSSQARRPPSRGSAPVLPSVSASPGPQATAPPPRPAPAAVMTPPPSASISIQPLQEPAAAEPVQPTRPPVAAATRPATLSDALRHQQMAAYYRRQGDHQAAYDEYQYARDLFRSVQQRGGRDAATAAHGAAAAQHGMSRLQGQ